MEKEYALHTRWGFVVFSNIGKGEALDAPIEKASLFTFEDALKFQQGAPEEKIIIVNKNHYLHG